MSDETAFLAAILEAPHDSAPWLVYSDWLDERGRPAATFIRERLYDLHRLAADMPRRWPLWIAALEAHVEAEPWRNVSLYPDRGPGDGCLDLEGAPWPLTSE